MNTVDGVAAGLALIATKSQSGKFITAEHDEIWSGDVSDFSAEEISQMEEWGWDVEEEYESFHYFV